MTNIYDVGKTVRLTATFDVAGTNTDPTTVTLKVKTPGGTISTYTYALAEITKSAAGIYYKDVAVTTSGIYYYRWEGTGDVPTADEGNFDVEISHF